MPSNNEIYERVTNKILDALEQGVVPWHRPWSSVHSGLHQNLVTKRPYRGVNQFLCEITAMSGDYSSPYWLSKKQIRDKKGRIRKGEKGTLIVFWKILRFKTEELDSNDQPIVKTVPLLKHYFVWNVEQCDGIKVPELPKLEFEPIERAQQVIDNMPSRPKISHRGDRAFYRPGYDDVTLPPKGAFHTRQAYYGTAYHELVHSTGHESRLHRVKDWTSFGSDPYANEELVAELGAAMLNGTVGIEIEHKQSAAYIDNWAKRIRADKKLIVGAAGKAQKAADYILGVSGNGEAEAEAAAEEKELAHV